MRGISKACGKVYVQMDNGEKGSYDYIELRDLVKDGKIKIDNMHIDKYGQLSFINKEQFSNKYSLSDNNKSDREKGNRRAGWHSGGDKKPYGFTHK